MWSIIRILSQVQGPMELNMVCEDMNLQSSRRMPPNKHDQGTATNGQNQLKSSSAVEMPIQ
jgi:hypothetical protein